MTKRFQFQSSTLFAPTCWRESAAESIWRLSFEDLIVELGNALNLCALQGQTRETLAKAQNISQFAQHLKLTQKKMHDGINSSHTTHIYCF